MFRQTYIKLPKLYKGFYTRLTEIVYYCEKYFNAPLGETLSFIPGTVLVKS